MSLPRILLIDTYYPAFLKSLPAPTGDYETEMAKLMDRCFGTFDAYARGLAELGWDAVDVIYNHKELNKLSGRTQMEQIRFDKNHVAFYQDLNLCKVKPVSPVVAGQISCAWPGDDIIRRFDILFTSFPHYVERIEALGVRAVYLPLAFDPIVYSRWSGPPIRRLDWSFVGGLEKQFGDRVNTVFRIAKEVPGYIYGYGGKGSYTYSHPQWGLDMYRVYASSKIVVNHHHPAAEGYSNNLRMFEATGMGALLLTEQTSNIAELFQPGLECATYADADHAIEQIRYYLDPAHEPERLAIAAAGHLRTLREHTYAQRMPIVDRELRVLLDSKKVAL